MFGSAQLRLGDLGLSGSYSMTPTSAALATLVDASSAQVTANLGGTLLAPTVAYDVSGLVDAIMVKAYEAEVARLEKLRAEDEARKKADEEQKASAEAAARKAEADAAMIRAADEAAARKAAEEAEAQKAADAAAAKKAAADAAAQKKADDEAAARAQAEALRRAQEEASKPLDLFGN